MNEKCYLKGTKPVAGLLWRNSNDHWAFLNTQGKIPFWSRWFGINSSTLKLKLREKTHCVVFIHKCANIILKCDGTIQEVLFKHRLHIMKLILD